VEAASTVETAGTVRATSASDYTAAVKSTSTSDYTATVVSTPGVTAGVAANIASSIAPTWASVESAAPVSDMTPSPVIPGSGTNKYSAYKPPRAIEAIRRASIRIIGVIAVWAPWRTIDIALVGIFVIVLIGTALVIVLIGMALVIVLVGTALIIVLISLPLIRSSGSSSIHLRLRVRKRQRQNGQQRQIFQITHMNPLVSRSGQLLFRTRKPSKSRWPSWVPFSLPWVPCLYLFERGTRRKVAGIWVADFSHPG
jgi:hypothetical protein